MRDLKLFMELKEARDVFTKTVEDELAKRDKALKDAPNNYRGERLKTETGRINSDFERAKAKAGERFNSRIDPLLKAAEHEAVSRTRTINGSKLRELKAVSDLPISAAEFNVLAPAFVNDYWSTVALREIAAKNGIVAEDCKNFKVEPGLDAELSVLEEIKNEAVQLVTEYDGSGALKHMMLLSDKKIEKWTDKATNGLISESSMSDSWLAHRAFTRIAAGHDELDRGQRISSELSKIRPSARLELLSKIADSRIIGDTALKLSGDAELWEMRRTGSNKEYEKAKALTADVVATLAEGNEHEAVRKLDAALAEDNKYFQTVMQKAAADDEALRKAAVAVDTARGTNLSGGNVTA